MTLIEVSTPSPRALKQKIIPDLALSLISGASSSSVTEGFNNKPESPRFVGTDRTYFHIDYLTTDAATGFFAA
jgi:hypothetical protein